MKNIVLSVNHCRADVHVCIGLPQKNSGYVTAQCESNINTVAEETLLSKNLSYLSGYLLVSYILMLFLMVMHELYHPNKIFLAGFSLEEHSSKRKIDSSKGNMH